VLITSRSAESWLGKNLAFRLPITGLQGEDCWTFCNALVKELGLTIDRNKEAYRGIIEKLGGHPLALQAAFSGLSERSPQAILESLERSFDGAEGDNSEDESTKRIFAALTVLTESFPAEFGEVLQLIGLHERFVIKENVTQMLNDNSSPTLINNVFKALSSGGLLHEVTKHSYAMHPSLPGFLRKTYTTSLNIESAFIDFMARYAKHIAPMQLHQQKPYFDLHRANFFYSLRLSEDKNMFLYQAQLTHTLAQFLMLRREFLIATRLYEQLAKLAFDNDYLEFEAGAFHHLGEIAGEQYDFLSAEKCYKKSLPISEKRGNKSGAAATYHQLGLLTSRQEDLINADIWFNKSLEIYEMQNDEKGMSQSYHQLGIIAEEHRCLDVAKTWYIKSLNIKIKNNNEEGIAATCHQLGGICEQEEDYSTAKDWYEQSLTISEKQGNEQGCALTYLCLGRLAKQQQKNECAHLWYNKALVISERLNDEHGVAGAKYQLGELKAKQSEHLSAAILFGISTNKFAKTNNNRCLNIVLQSFFHLITQVRQEQPELETEIINHFNTTNADCLSEWSEIERQLTQPIQQQESE
jgi:tetratricopeptide (TPR) repeat protein